MIDNLIKNAESSILLADGLEFNTQETIKRIRHYVNNQYLDRDDDAIFWNISESRVLHFAKNIDIDTKDLYPEGEGEVSFVQAWILRMKLSKWLEDNKMAVELNDLMESVPRYGSAVWKITKKDGNLVIDEVDLQNLRFNQTAKSLRGIDKVEIHYMNENDFRAMEDVWDISEIKRKDEYKVLEFWGYNDGEYKHNYYFETEKNLIYTEDRKKDDDPYWDFHVGKYEGRWLRRGVTEKLFDLQAQANRLVNQNIERREISSLLLLKSANPDFSGNVLTDVLNGQIIPDETLEQIGISNTEFTAFTAELALIEQKSDQLAFTPEVITGEQLPANTPFRSIAVQTNAAKSVFRFVRQNIGESVGYIIKNVILKAEAKDWNTEHIIDVARNDRDIKIYEETFRKAIKWKFFVNRILKGELVTPDDLIAVDRQIDAAKETRVPRIKIPKNFFNFDYLIKVRVTNESRDKQQSNDAYFNSLTMIGQNPALANIPLFKQYLENNGIDWWQITPEQTEQIQQGATGAKPIGEKQDKLLSKVDSE